MGHDIRRQDSYRSKLLAGLFAAALFSCMAQALAWTGPSTAPSSNNASIPLNAGGTGQSKVGALTLNTGGATYGLLIPYGKVGIGTANPAASLSVAGGVQFGDDAATCVSAKAGTLRYHSQALQYCDGSSWTSI
ncbi:MAG TPA: hypothetical protein VFQ72_00810 [Candidatus Paceibacterota bacterium]|nr:hypothetical protein [Candidatus Paceibacterota bacterium]